MTCSQAREVFKGFKPLLAGPNAWALAEQRDNIEAMA